MASTMLMAAVAQVRIANEDTQRCVAIRDFAILLTVIESDNPRLVGKQTYEPIQAEPLIAEAMFHEIVSNYGTMAHRTFQRLSDWKYAGWFEGQQITLELVILK